jgi:hypothetical protein
MELEKTPTTEAGWQLLNQIVEELRHWELGGTVPRASLIHPRLAEKLIEDDIDGRIDASEDRRGLISFCLVRESDL